MKFKFGFKLGVLDVLDAQIADGVTKRALAKKVGVDPTTLSCVLKGRGMSVSTTAKFIKYFQKYYGWSKDEWREKLVEL